MFYRCARCILINVLPDVPAEGVPADVLVNVSQMFCFFKRCVVFFQYKCFLLIYVLFNTCVFFHICVS